MRRLLPRGVLGARAWFRPASFAIALLLVGHDAQAQDDLLRYQPPPVDALYPEQGPILAPQAPPPFPVDEPSGPPGAKPEGKAIHSEPDLAEQSGQAAEPTDETEDSYGASAQVAREDLPGPHTLSMEEARDFPGAFGDPLRVLDALPGVVPISSGLPYGYLRGAPPATIGYVYDGIPLPQLFHAAFLPAVLHPRTMSDVKLYGGVPPAQVGRRAGGAMVLTPVAPATQAGGEVELRLIDFGGWVEGPLGSGSVMASGRLGYPKLALATAEALGMLDPGTSINYWDGQLRFRIPIGRRDYLETVWLGSYDYTRLGSFGVGTAQPVDDESEEESSTALHFQRLETRLVRRTRGGGQVGTALRFGFDDSVLGTAATVTAYTFGPRFWSRWHMGRHTIQMGADLYASRGQLINKPGGVFSGPEGPVQVVLPTLAAAPARNQGGVYAELQLVGDWARVDLGARVDYWSTLSEIELAVDPRARIAFDLSKSFTVHVAGGLAHQPAVFLLPLPGLSEIALDDGLTRAVHSEIGGEIKLTPTTRLKLQGYYHRYDGLLLPELVQDAAIRDDPPLVTADAYGLEVFLDRDFSERLAGWLSYTYGFATADSGPDVVGRFKPDFDVRHVLNAILNWRIWRGLELGLRGQVRSGRVVEQLNPRYTQRLPWFARADVRLGYSWSGRLGEMKAYIEVLNASLQREYLDADCLLGTCVPNQAPLVTIPNVGVRAQF